MNHAVSAPSHVTTTTPYRVVWFKRDLRLHDHATLAQAAAHGPVLCLYVLEPSLWAQPDAAAQHLAFIHESLRDLHRALKAYGGQLHLRVGEVTDVLAELHAQHPFDALHAHEETGNAHTYARDLAVGRWCRAHGVGWHEVPQFGVVRRLGNRNTWQPQWEALMAAPMATLPPLSFFDPPAWGTPDTRHRWPTPEWLHTSLGLNPWQPPRRQPGGEANGLAILADFLDHRSTGYRG
ncbi:MAG: deoxyribodipyrimidine photo-lyase, partial [Burkholderiaceae bacterium]